MSAKNFDVFVSYNRKDSVFVKQLAERLRDNQIKLFFDIWHLTAGKPWQEELREALGASRAVAICIGPYPMNHWQMQEKLVALDRQASVPGFQVIPVLLPDAELSLDFLFNNTWIDFRNGLDDAYEFQRFCLAIQGLPLETAHDAHQEAMARECPYRGLQFFREEDAAFFFGRAAAVNSLLDKLRQSNFVALIGASGAGKSSVVRAGVLPKLRKQTHNPWEVATMFPGEKPLRNLMEALLPILEPGIDAQTFSTRIDETEQAWLSGKWRIPEMIAQILAKQPHSRLLLVVDQWEELYAADTSAEAAGLADPARIFVDGLLDACQSSKLHVIMTVRGDFMGQVIAYRRLADALSNAQVNLSAMTTEELREVISEPAKRRNANLEPALVDQLLTDVRDAPGNLPLLEFVLERLWHDTMQRDQRVLSLQSYRAMNGLKGALAQKADETYHSLASDQDRQALRGLLLSLVKCVTVGVYTRHRVYRRDLGKYSGLIDQLTKARLLVRSRDETGNDTVEVAHEALIRDWPKLRDWLKDESEFLLWLDRLRRMSDEFDHTRHTSDLLDGLKLQDAKNKMKSHAGLLTPHDVQYIKTSNRHSHMKILRRVAVLLAPTTALVFFLWAANQELPVNVAGRILAAQHFHYLPEPEMVLIPPEGECQNAVCSFNMGSDREDTAADDNEKPMHTVKLNNAFKLAKYELTFDEYQVFAYLQAKSGNCTVSDNPRDNYPLPKPADSNFGYGKHPAINVSWRDAQCYIHWLNDMTGKHYRLPTEAEWEFAIRAGSSDAYYWGEQQLAAEFARFNRGERADDESSPIKVGQLKPNKFGLYDMAGNVWEWVQDCYQPYTANTPRDASAVDKPGCVMHVQRGGSWHGAVADLRSANRGKGAVDQRGYNLGFRLAED